MISIEQLTAEKFAPFGDVIDYEDPHDAVFLDDTTDIVSDVACIDATSRKGRAQVDILRLTPQALPVTIASVLRNQDATTAFDVGPALACLGTLFRFHGLSFDAETVRREFAGASRPGAADIVRIARRINLKSRAVTSSMARLTSLPLPALALDRSGRAFILARVQDGKALIQRSGAEGGQAAPQLIELSALAEIWDGSLVLMTKRAKLSDLGQQFGILWFLRAVYKYRSVLGQVLLASFFLQLFGLISPLFFQVVVDKVLVHRGVSTLDVLLIGLVAVSVFETVLGALRTYVFSHTTNRIDVELGARLFRHLIALPLAYFGLRRGGGSVSQGRELGNIHPVLTG